jgi:hypothetical protein
LVPKGIATATTVTTVTTSFPSVTAFPSTTSVTAATVRQDLNPFPIFSRLALTLCGMISTHRPRKMPPWASSMHVGAGAGRGAVAEHLINQVVGGKAVGLPAQIATMHVGASASSAFPLPASVSPASASLVRASPASASPASAGVIVIQRPPLRITARGAELIDHAGRPVLLQGVNMYLEWYRRFYGTTHSGSSAFDIPHLRRAVPAANAIRFVGLLWNDAIKESDGLECSTDDPATGYLDEQACMTFVDALVKQATEAGFWIILAARATYAAGWNPEEASSDVWNDLELRERMYAMWRTVARRYKWTDRIAGYEIMSEPRTKSESQASVRDFLRGGCEVIHAEDPGELGSQVESWPAPEQHPKAPMYDNFA